MTLPELVRVFAVALYNETALRSYGRFKIRDIVELYSLPWKEIWSRNFEVQLRETNYARVFKMGGEVLDDYVSIGAMGVHFVETNVHENTAAYLEQHGAVYRGETVVIESGSIDSALWTGSPSQMTVAVENRERLIEMLGRAEQDLQSLDASNAEIAMARAYLVAAKTLAETPDPPEDVIWELISRASSIAGVASLLVAVIALFVAGRS